MKRFYRGFAIFLLSGAFASSALCAQTAPPPAPASSSTASGQRLEPEANSAGKKQEAEEGSEAFKHSPSVQKLGGMLGMKPATASSAFEWLNFLVLVAALLYGILRFVPKMLHKRGEGIQKDIVEARSATEEARLRLAAVEDRLAKLDGEISAFRSDSDRAAAEEEQAIAAQVESEKQRILQAAEQEIAAASAQAQRSLRAYAAQIAVDRAADELQITPEDDRALIQSFAGKLSNEGSRN